MEQFYVRNTQGKVFGPIGLEALKGWVRDGRVEPLAGISNDLKNWVLAPLKPELEMNWLVENQPGQFYGPTHLAVVEDLKRSGVLSVDARFYQDDHGSNAKRIAELERITTEKESAAAQAQESLNQIRNTFAAKDAELAELKKTAQQRDEQLSAALAEINRLREQLANREAQLALTKKELAEKSTVQPREWAAEEVVEPEVIISGPPPPSARNVFASTAAAPNKNLADLERQAQAELARMSARGKNIFNFMKK